MLPSSVFRTFGQADLPRLRATLLEWYTEYEDHNPAATWGSFLREQGFIFNDYTLERNALLELAALSDQDVENATIDGLWQTLILAGVQELTPFSLEFRSYEAPTYYGMIVATAVVGDG